MFTHIIYNKNLEIHIIILIKTYILVKQSHKIINSIILIVM